MTLVDEPSQATLAVTPTEEEEEDDSSLCVVCIRGAIARHRPCGHMCLCETCVTTVRDACPMCRGSVSATVRVYM